MKSVGYTTGAVGKWHLGQIADTSPTQLGNRPQNQGIDEFFGIWHGSRTYNVGNANLSQTQLLREAINNNGAITDTVVETAYSGQYITNTFGDYAVNFIADHHDDGNPFFLYQSFTAPHTPMQNSPDFNDPSLAGLSGIRKTYGSMMLTMDKEIGRIVDRLDDPNGDGDTSDSITDNTLIFFINDNGGADANSSSPNGADNGVLRRGKGSPWEGGIRVPMLMAGAGISSSVENTVYDKPVHGVDILATAFEAGGGMFGPSDTGVDGVNLLPFVNGIVAGDPHEVLINRHRAHFSVIKGDWKLTWSGGSPGLNPQLYNLATDISETSNVAGANPAIVADLRRALTDQESEFDKQRYAILGRSQSTINLFDHFTFNPMNSNSQNWLGSNSWFAGGTNIAETMFYSDSFASNVLEFPTSNSFSYTSNNDMVRLSGNEYMLNQMLLTGSFNSAQNRTANITGNALLFTDSLLGAEPEIVVSASNSSSGQFSYQIDTDLVLYDELLISGDGDAQVSIGGQVRDYFLPRGLTKTGNSTVALTADNTYSGDTVIAAGTLALSGAGTLGGSSYIDVQSGGTLDASAASGGLDVGVGQTLAGEGSIVGDVTAGNGSVVAPAGSGIGTLNINGGYTHQPGASLEMQLSASGNDVLDVSGAFDAAGGELVVTLDAGFTPADGQSFVLLNFSSFAGDFDSTQLPALGGGLGWNTSELATTGTITVGDPEVITTVTTPPSTTVILGGAVGNADFEATAPATGAQTYHSTPNWFNAGGADTINFTNTSQTNGSTQAGSIAGMPFQNRTQINDTGYVIQAAGEVFSLSYDFGAGGNSANWNGDETMRTFIFTSTTAVNDATVVGDMTELGSDSYPIDRANDGQWTSHAAANFYTTDASDIGKTVYFGMQFLDASGNTLFPRIDVVELQVDTPGIIIYLGDCNLNDVVDFSDIPAFISVLMSGSFLDQADCNRDGVVDFADIPAFIAILTSI
jgi:autotransporter-associated beta strand protein